MSAIELLYGARAPGTFGNKATALKRDARDEVVLKDVEIHYALFEVPMVAVLPRLPASLHPSVPAILGITAWRCTDGPLGAFTLMYLGIACRTGIKPRHLIHGAYCSNAEVGKWLQERYGLCAALGQVHSLETYDRAHTRVEVNGNVVLDLVTDRLQPLAGRGAMVKYSPILNAARVDEDTVLVQMETSFDFKRVNRGTPAATVFDAVALGDATLAPHYPVSGTFALADVTLHPARFKLDLKVPAEAGGAKKL